MIHPKKTPPFPLTQSRHFHTLTDPTAWSTISFSSSAVSLSKFSRSRSSLCRSSSSRTLCFSITLLVGSSAALPDWRQKTTPAFSCHIIRIPCPTCTLSITRLDIAAIDRWTLHALMYGAAQQRCSSEGDKAAKYGMISWTGCSMCRYGWWGQHVGEDCCKGGQNTTEDWFNYYWNYHIWTVVHLNKWNSPTGSDISGTTVFELWCIWIHELTVGFRFICIFCILLAAEYLACLSWKCEQPKCNAVLDNSPRMHRSPDPPAATWAEWSVCVASPSVQLSSLRALCHSERNTLHTRDWEPESQWCNCDQLALFFLLFSYLLLRALCHSQRNASHTRDWI